MGGSHETPFKMKGSGHYGLGNSSPAKKTPSATHKASATHKHPHLTDEQLLAAANRRKAEGIKSRQSKYNISKEKATEIWTEQNPPLEQPEKKKEE